MSAPVLRQLPEKGLESLIAIWLDPPEDLVRLRLAYRLCG